MNTAAPRESSRRRRVPVAVWIFVVLPCVYLAGMHLPGHRLAHSQRVTYFDRTGTPEEQFEESVDYSVLSPAGRSNDWDQAPRQSTPGTSGRALFRLLDPSGTRELMFFADTRQVEPEQSDYGYIGNTTRRFEVPDLPEGRGKLTCVARRLVGSRWARDGLSEDDVRAWLYDQTEPSATGQYRTLVQRVELDYVLTTEPDGTTRLMLEGDAGLQDWQDFRWELVTGEQEWAMVPTVLKTPVSIAFYLVYLLGPLPPGG